MTEMPLPASLAELLERSGKAAGGRRILGARAAGGSGRHDISENGLVSMKIATADRRHFTAVKANRALTLLP